MKKFLLAIVACLISLPALAVYQPKNGETQKFEMVINGEAKVGIYQIDYKIPQEGAILATTTSVFKVTLLDKELVDARSQSNELIWQGKFLELQGIAKNGDDTYELKMTVLDDGKVHIVSHNHDEKSPIGTMPFSFWNKDTLNATYVYDAIGQKVIEMNYKKIRIEELAVLGKTKRCMKYKLTNDDGVMYLWYGEEDEKLCRVLIRGGKFELTYQPYE